MKPRKRAQMTPEAPLPTTEEMEPLVQAVRTKLKSFGSAKMVAEFKRKYGEGISCYGVPTAQVYQVGLDLVRRMRTGGLSLAMGVADPLWRTGNLEEGLVAAQLVGAMGRHIGGGNFERFEEWAGMLTNWATADALALQMVSRSLAAKPSLVNRLKGWAGAGSPGLRRAAVMTFVPLVRDGRFLTDAFTVLEGVMLDQDPQVEEAVAFMLVEASRLQPDRVYEFLEGWQSKLGMGILRKASMKLSNDQRNRLLSGQGASKGPTEKVE